MLLFEVNGQSLKRTDHFNPATDSVEYLKAKFTFKDSAWSGKTKTALFRMGTDVYKSVLSADGTCKVPAEVLVGGDSRVSMIRGETIHVSLIGEYSTVRITTDEVAVKLNRSGYADAETPADPTESEYQQMTAVAADAVAEAENARSECENARADLVNVKNLFANAIKGKLSGAVVAADDVSPVEHNPVGVVHGKNLFDTSKIPVQASTDVIYISAVGEGYIDITTKEAYDGNGHCVTFVKLKELCPQMRAGKQYALSGTTTAWNKMIYLKEIDLFWSYGTRQIVTEEMLECTIGFYGLNSIREQGFGTCRISNIQCEEGYDITEYTPYIDPSTVTVKRCGKNLAPTLKEKITVNGLTVTPMEDGSFKISGAITGEEPTGILYITHYAADVRLKARQPYTMKLYKDGVLLNKTIGTRVVYEDTGTVAWNVLGDETKERVLNYAYLFHNSLPVGDTTLCGTYKLQLEAGSVATEFEPYKEPTDYIPTLDGTVKGMTSLSPNMTILTDTEGAIVECEYIRDTNKVIEKLTKAITALGGTV